MFEATRRKMIAASVIGAGAALGALAQKEAAADLPRKGKVKLEREKKQPRGLIEAMQFPLIEAIHGRRSRRFARGANIPDGPLQYASQHAWEPVSQMEQMLLLTAMAGNTGWSNLIPHNKNYAPKIPNYAGAAGGRTAPSAAGFQTSDIFFTDDAGTYYLPTRDMAAVVASDKQTDLDTYLDAHRARIVKLSDTRLNIPRKPQHMEMHNEWCANVPGSTLIMPVADLAQHVILALCYLVQNGACIYDDVNNKPVPGIENFKSLVDTENPYPLSFFEQVCLTEVTVETSTACYAGALMLQALGLGGWMFDGINQFSILGASGDPEVPGLGFRFDMIQDSPLPHVTGLPGVFEGHCPPHFNTMRAAVESVVARKFDNGGPFNAKTDGPYRKNELVRTSAVPIDDTFIACVSNMAQYIYDTFGRFPATVPAIFNLMYLQAHQLDTGFYDAHFAPGAYLHTHKDHDKNWRDV